MQINYSTEAFRSLLELVNYIEATNTEGAGRWVSPFESFLEARLLQPQTIKLCNNLTFKKLLLRCINFNDWIIAFSVHKDFVVIEALLHKSRLSD